MGGVFDRVGSLLGSMGIKASTRPDERPVTAIFVLGGISPLEVKCIQELCDKDKDKDKRQVFIGSTSWCEPSTVLKTVFETS